VSDRVLEGAFEKLEPPARKAGTGWFLGGGGLVTARCYPTTRLAGRNDTDFPKTIVDLTGKLE